MTYEQTREQFLLACNSNAYLNMCTSDDMKNVITALDKQIPMKPVHNEHCPVCNTEVSYYYVDLDMVNGDRKVLVYDNYCTCCGQAIDWSK